MYIQDALDFLCRAAKVQLGEALPEPPENPGNAWVLESAKAIADTFGDSEDDEDDEDGPEEIGAYLKTLLPM